MEFCKNRLGLTMKKILVTLIFLTLLLSGCVHTKNAEIAATTLPVYEFTNYLCEGTGISITRLITENVSCLHDYTLKVSQMQAIASAEIIVMSGGGLEDFLADTIPEGKYIIDASSQLSLAPLHDPAHEHEHGNKHHHEQDPHFWLSPNHAKQMCKTIYQELSGRYPEHRETFEKNLSRLLSELDALQTYGEDTLQNLTCRNLITFHDGFSYLADSFQLHILKAVEEESGSEASAKDLIALIQLVETNSLPAIFTETNGSTSAAEIIASETGISIYTLDMAMAGNSYFESMYRNIDTIKEAFG